jgi:catechol 2,3-dioxygenase-like lactoylglutathione lyase family enzyme
MEFWKKILIRQTNRREKNTAADIGFVPAVRKLLPPLFLMCLLSPANGQTHFLPQTFIGIDHIPIVVKDLDGTSKFFSEVLHFKIKNGKAHEGIKNGFVKFQDGTYLELTMPIDPSKEIGKYYAEALKVRQGGTELAISVQSADTVSNYLKSNLLSFDVSTNPVWKTVSPKGIDLFFIEYANKKWKDTKEHTTHPNTALSLKSTYLFSNNITGDVKKYLQYGFRKTTDGYFLNTPFVQLTVGKSNLYLLDASKAGKLSSKLKTAHLKGIGGFEITVSSLATLNALLSQTKDVLVEPNRTICFLEKYNLFLLFSE